MIEFACTHCHKSLKADEKYVGRRAKCKFCQHPVVVPHVIEAPPVTPPPVTPPPVTPPPPPPRDPLDDELDALLAEPVVALTPVLTIPCPFCAEPIQPQALKCRHCGEFLRGHAPAQQVIVQNVIQQGGGGAIAIETKDGVIGALLSFVWPGLGQMVQGRIGAGVLWMFGVFLGYAMLIIPGLILHLVCIIDAARGVPQLREVRTATRTSSPPQLPRY